MNTPKSGSLTEEAYTQLRVEILACRLVPGQKLIIADLCTSLGVSLGAVRQNLNPQLRIGFFS